MIKILPFFSFLLFSISLSQCSYGQKDFPGVVNSKISAYVSINGGLNFSFATAYWLTRDNLIGKIDMQPGVNLSFNLAVSRYSIGNKNRQGSRTQLNVVLSPMNVFGVGGKASYEEIGIFKMGHANALVANNKWQFVIGSNFVLTPKSNVNIFRAKFNKDNVYSSKNRSQQLIFVGIRGGFNFGNNRRTSFQVMHYNDNMIIPYILQRYADNYDRYYTGGFRVGLNYYGNADRPGNNPFNVTYGSDVYTGAFERDLFDYPDIYDINEQFDTNKPELTRHARFVNQEPGERMLNEGRKILNVNIPFQSSLSPIINEYRNAGFNFFVGIQGGEQGIRSQNRNHSKKAIYKVNAHRYNTFSLHDMKGPDKIELERLHWFNPTVEAGRIIVGFGYNSQL